LDNPLSIASAESAPVAAAPEVAGSSQPRTPKVKAPQVPKVNKMAPKAKKEATMVEGAAKIGIEYKKDADFPKWYQQVKRSCCIVHSFFPRSNFSRPDFPYDNTKT
jgi:hypothetical protein